MQKRMTAAADAFWNHALAVYARPGVAPIVLALQDQHGAEVNIVLYCLYAGAVLGWRLSPDDIRRLSEAVEPWSLAAVQPLRALRRSLKRFSADVEAEALRQAVKMLELDAERIVQARIVAALPARGTAPGSAAVARANLSAYLPHIDPGLLQTLIEAAIC